jgi:hypothetical protein
LKQVSKVDVMYSHASLLPGSFAIGSEQRIIACMDMSTWSSVLLPATQPGPDQVPSSDKQTLPSA